MVKRKKLILFFTLISCFFIVISSATAADLYVKEKTSYDDIKTWMKTAEKGDSLIFNSSKYNLTNTLQIDNDINVKSTKNTKINFNKNKHMFIIISNTVTFSNLTLNHNGKGSVKKYISSVTASKDDFKIINFNKVNINTKKSFVSGIYISFWNGNVSESKINTKGIYGHGVSSDYWYGNFVDNIVTTNGKGSVAVNSIYWYGKVSGSKIYNNAPNNVKRVPIGILSPFGNGTITKSTVKVPNGYALKLDKNIKVTSCSLVSKKGFLKNYKFLPDLSINIKNIKRFGSTYSIKVFNNDTKLQHLGSSNPCHLGIKIGSYLKTVKVKALNYGHSTTVKVTIPSKYNNKKYTKTVKVDYYNKIKEENKKNNLVRFNKIADSDSTAKLIDNGRIWYNGVFYTYFTKYSNKNYLVTEMYYYGTVQKVNKITLSKWKNGKFYKNKIYLYKQSTYQSRLTTGVHSTSETINSKNSVKWYYNKYMKNSLKMGKMPLNIRPGIPVGSIGNW